LYCKVDFIALNDKPFLEKLVKLLREYLLFLVLSSTIPVNESAAKVSWALNKRAPIIAKLL